MPFKRTPITFDLFNQTKKDQGHQWTFLAQERLGPRKEKQVLCRCDLCRTEHWVFWRWVRLGRSKRCSNCYKKPENFADLNDQLKREGIFWKVANVTRHTVSRAGEKKRTRSYWCTCTKCGHQRWIPWSTIQQRQMKQCRDCMGKSRRLFADPIDKNLYDRWMRLQKTKDTKQMPEGVSINGFTDFETFRVWSINSGFKLGYRLNRISRKLPFSPENCRWGETPHITKWEKRQAKAKPKDIKVYDRNWARPKFG